MADLDDLSRPFVFGSDERLQADRDLANRKQGDDIRTICNVIRHISDDAALIPVQERREHAQALCAEAIFMAKRMDLRLRVYKHDWDRGLWLPEHETFDGRKR
jgi:hypothetical protein